MIARTIAVVWTCALLMACGAGCSGNQKLSARIPLEVSFDWTCDAKGRLEPCGCFTGQHGGLSRVSTFMRSNALEGEHLLVDAGNAIAGTEDYQVIQYRYMQKAFGSMGYLALNIGEREAELPLPELVRLRNTATVPMISANLLDRATGKRVFEPFRVVKVREYRIAFIGVLGDVSAENLGAGLALEPMISTVAKVLPEAKKQADAVVLLAFASDAAMRALADEFYELDVILGGKVKEPSQQLAKQNRTIVLSTTNETKALGMFRAKLGGPARFTPLDFNIRFIDEQIPQDEKLTRLAQNYRDEIRKTALAVDDPAHVNADEIPGVKTGAEYVGSESCSACHQKSHEIWQKSGHARAFRSLVARQSDADPNCIGCHTIGFGTPSGYRREWAGGKFAEVGCENCHGPGSQHVAERKAGGAVLFHYRPVSATDCTSCHYGEFSRVFNYTEFWEAVRHGKEEPVAVNTVNSDGDIPGLPHPIRPLGISISVPANTPATAKIPRPPKRK